jgi:hypothetical protein
MSTIIDLTTQEPTANLVTTNIGIVPESELEIKLDKKDDGESWTITRTCMYVGSLHPHARGQVVRQDVWVAMKNGIKAGVQSGL